MSQWLDYVQRCEACDIVCVESHMGSPIFPWCPGCDEAFVKTAKPSRLPRFVCLMLEASGRYPYKNRVEVAGYDNPFWIRGVP